MFNLAYVIQLDLKSLYYAEYIDSHIDAMLSILRSTHSFI